VLQQGFTLFSEKQVRSLPTEGAAAIVTSTHAHYHFAVQACVVRLSMHSSELSGDWTTVINSLCNRFPTPTPTRAPLRSAVADQIPPPPLPILPPFGHALSCMRRHSSVQYPQGYYTCTWTLQRMHLPCVRADCLIHKTLLYDFVCL